MQQNSIGLSGERPLYTFACQPYEKICSKLAEMGWGGICQQIK